MHPKAALFRRGPARATVIEELLGQIVAPLGRASAVTRAARGSTQKEEAKERPGLFL
jgi:hypothetical protein